MTVASVGSEMVPKPWWVYMVETESGKLYTGVSTDVDRRFKEHQSSASSPAKSRGARYFRMDPPKCVVWREQLAGRSEALKREAAIKKMPAATKRRLLLGIEP